MSFQYVHPLQEQTKNKLIDTLTDLIVGNIYELNADRNLFLDEKNLDILTEKANSALLEAFDKIADDAWDDAQDILGQ